MQERTNAGGADSVHAAEDQTPGAAEHREDGERHREADRPQQEQEEDEGDDREGDQK